MRRVLIAVQLLVVAAAATLAATPPPPAFVERYYADWLYPALQAHLTSWSNDTGVALFDFILIFFIAGLVVLLWRTVARTAAARSVVPFVRGLLAIATLLAVAYFWFEGAWGLNYARVPLETTIGYDARQVTPERLRELATRAVDETNRRYADGHAAGFPEPGAVPPALVAALHQVEHRLGRPRPTVPGRPKRTLLSAFFRASGTDGMHAPFMLETLLNPDLTGPERPAVLAHEWAHLAGYAPEDDASFVGLLAALRADPAARYSAWMALLFETGNQLPRDERQRLMARLDSGPQQDVQAIVARLQARVEVVQRASWEAYDRYLKTQGVREGIQSYSRVVQLLLGSNAVEWGD